MKTAPPEASMGIMLTAMDGEHKPLGCSQPTCRFGEINTVMAAFDHSAESKTQYKMLHLELHPGALSPGCYVSSMLLTLVEDFPISILPTPSIPCPWDPAIACGSRRTDHSPRKAFAHRALSYLTRLDMHGHQTEPAI